MTHEKTPREILAEAEENFEKMQKARIQCIAIWNRNIHAARKDIERRRNELRTGNLQPELLHLLQGNNKLPPE